MVASKKFKINSKSIMLSVLLSLFSINAHAMLQSWKNLTSSVAQHLATRNLYKLGKFNTMNIAPLSSQSSFNSKNSKKNKWITAGIFGSLGISTIAINQDSQKNTGFNALLNELQNNDAINLENKISTTSKPKQPMLNPNNNGLLTEVRAQFQNFIGTAPLHMDELNKDEINPTDQLFKAIENGTLKDVKRCIKDGADINTRDKFGVTPLCDAVKNGNTAIIKALLDAGANPNKTGIKTAFVYTPLHIASFQGNIDAIKILLDADANPNTKTTIEETALHAAAQCDDTNNSKKAIDILLNADANIINAKNIFGETPLHYAVKENNILAIKALLNAGANINAQNCHNLTPYDTAIMKGNQEAINLLKPSLFIRLIHKIKSW